MSQDPGAALLALLRASHEMEPGELGRLTNETAVALGAQSAELFLVDLEQRQLRPVGSSGLDTTASEPVPVDGTLAGRAFISSETQQGQRNGVTRFWVALVDGVDRLGVLRIDAAGQDADVPRWGEDLAGLVTTLLVTKNGYTDAFTRAARVRDLSLAAEVHRVLLPPLTLMTPRVSVTGILEPAYDVGGDAFDYAANGDRLDLAVFDAMGHGLGATGASALAVGSVRHSRRRDFGLAAIYEAADAALRTVYDERLFVTAFLACLDLASGRLGWINAGHPPPLLMRGSRVLGPLSSTPALPLGLGGEPGEASETCLEPGDRLLLFTDGVVDGRPADLEPFGEDRLIEQFEKAALAGLAPAETMRRAAHAILDHHAHELRDDFTMLLVEYRGSRLGTG